MCVCVLEGDLFQASGGRGEVGGSDGDRIQACHHHSSSPRYFTDPFLCRSQRFISFELIDIIFTSFFPSSA